MSVIHIIHIIIIQMSEKIVFPQSLRKKEYETSKSKNISTRPKKKDDTTDDTAKKSDTVINIKQKNKPDDSESDHSDTVIQINQNKMKKADDDSEENKPKDITQIETDGEWNYKIVLLLQKIGKKTMGYRWMHDQESKNNNDQDGRYMIADIVLKLINGLLTGSSMASLVSNPDIADNIIVLYILTALALIIELASGVITAIRESNNFADTAIKHNYAATKFSEINLDIQNQLSLNLKDRDTDKDFLKNIIKKYNDLIMIVPQISEEVKNTYIASSDENDIYNPIIVGDYNNIQIIDKKEEIETNDTDRKVKSDYEINRWLQHF